MRGLVFDLRGNPGGLLDVAQEVASRFIPNGPIVWIKEPHGDHADDGASGRDASLHRGHKQFPLVVLVDGGSASAAEIVSGAIKDTHSGLLIGRKDIRQGAGADNHAAGRQVGGGSSPRSITYTAGKNDINHKGHYAQYRRQVLRTT